MRISPLCTMGARRPGAAEQDYDSVAPRRGTPGGARGGGSHPMIGAATAYAFAVLAVRATLYLGVRRWSAPIT